MPSPTASQNQPASKSKNLDVPNLKSFNEAKTRIKTLVSGMDELEVIAKANRALRYTEIDIEAERKAGRLAPDELYVPNHIIDSNIRREQAKYVAYISSSRRAVVLENLDDPSLDTTIAEKDFTDRVRYDGWQFPLYRMVDGMQQNAYGIVELVPDMTAPGHLKLQEVAYGDFGFAKDTKELQSCEMVTRRYFFTKSQLLAMADPQTWKFSRDQVERVVTNSEGGSQTDYKDNSLFAVEKIMFRLKGVVHVAWSCEKKCDDWLREPRPLYIGRQTKDLVTGKWVKAFETAYPYFLAQYNISENTCISQLKGRAYMDQDTQEAVSSLMSSYVTAHRRAAGLYFTREENDPNADVVTQQNTTFKTGCLINAKVKQFQLQPPDSTMLSAVQSLSSMNMQESAQIDFAAQNRRDSRKTATEIQAAQTESQLLSTIQLALFSATMKGIYQSFWDIFVSRVKASLVNDVRPPVANLYVNYRFKVKPSGDTDVIEKQEKLVKMQQAWPVVETTAIAPIFLQKLLQLMFPDDAPAYLAAMQEDQSKNMVIQSLSHVLSGIVSDPSQLSPQAQQHIPAIVQLLQQAQLATMPPQQRQEAVKQMPRQASPQSQQPQQSQTRNEIPAQVGV